jgi:uncharacterized protein (TIGR03437 family)
MIGTASRFDADAMPFELAGASVTIAGRAAPLRYVSPSRVDFCVPDGMTPGEAEVIITSQDGTVSRGTVMISAFAPGLFTQNGAGRGAGASANAFAAGFDTFDVLTPQNFGVDKRTRVRLAATGVGARSSLNTVTANDLLSPGGEVLANFAESVTVEARTATGRTLNLPVEFAGEDGGVSGLAQITVVLDPELRGAGVVELTLIVGGQRSNSVTIGVR